MGIVWFQGKNVITCLLLTIIVCDSRRFSPTASSSRIPASGPAITSKLFTLTPAFGAAITTNKDTFLVPLKLGLVK